ncbi:MAG: universal stress protein [Fimbriimonadaceae bacterium]
MKAVVGVGYMKLCLAGLEVFVRLKFPDPSVVLVHTVEPVLPDGGFVPIDSSSAIAEIQRQRKEDGEKRSAEVAAELTAKGVPSASQMTFGNPAHEITEAGEREGADLIIAGSNKKGSFESFLMGSVARALVADAKRSILIGKQQLKEGEKVSAVLATDHSEYADKCVDALVAMAPGGLGKVTVVYADTTSDDVWEAIAGELPEDQGRETLIQRRNEAVCDKLREVCGSVESVVLKGDAEDVIDATMKQTGADLLILGAHGHGFIERLLMGSTAMHMVGNSPWNVLVLRVKDGR